MLKTVSLLKTDSFYTEIGDSREMTRFTVSLRHDGLPRLESEFNRRQVVTKQPGHGNNYDCIFALVKTECFFTEIGDSSRGLREPYYPNTIV